MKTELTEALAALPWTRANGHESRHNIVSGEFVDNELNVHLRDSGPVDCFRCEREPAETNSNRRATL